jgi:hypothetical protein
MYLSEASISDMLSSHFQQPVAETLERISPDIPPLKQYMDFVRNRPRPTLLVHDSVKRKRALTPAGSARIAGVVARWPKRFRSICQQDDSGVLEWQARRRNAETGE